MVAGALVSVVIPTYNRAYCLPETIGSVLAQTHPHLEILVVDDGSTDDTEQVLSRRFPAEPRLRYVKQPNRGVSAARNLGMSTARGDFIALLDSDDAWQPWKLEAQLACLRRFPAAVMVHSEMEAVDENDRVIGTQYLRAIYPAYRRFPIEDIYPAECSIAELPVAMPPALADARVRFGDVYSHHLTGNLVHTSTILLARAKDGTVERYDETMRTEETFGFHLRIARRGPVAFLDAPSTRYRRGRADHLWKPEGYSPEVTYETDLRYLQVLEPLITQALASGDGRIRVPLRELRDTLANAQGCVAESALRLRRRREMLRHVAASLRMKPWQPRRLLRLAKHVLRDGRGG